jgi:hypothetical protein
MQPQQVVDPVVVVDALEPIAFDARFAQEPARRVCASEGGILIDGFIFHG